MDKVNEAPQGLQIQIETFDENPSPRSGKTNRFEDTMYDRKANTESAEKSKTRVPNYFFQGLSDVRQ